MALALILLPLTLAVVAIQRRVLGEEHPSTLFSMAEQAELYGKQGKYRQSETLYTKVLEARRRVLGAQHPDTADVIASLGRVLLQEHKYAEAEPLLLSRYQGMLQQAIIPNESRARLQEAGEQVVQLYDAWGKPEKVAEWRQKLEKVLPSVPAERP